MLLLILTLLSLLHPSHSHYIKLPLHRTIPLSSAALLPVTSGAASGSGQYFVSLLLGTPPQPLLLAADTGSDLIWTKCSPCRHRSVRVSPSSLYPRLSSSFSPHHCFSPQCRLTPKPPHAPHCPHTRLHSPCFYEYKYADRSHTSGIFSTETITFNTTTGRLLSLPGLSFGCGFNNSAPSLQGAQGVLGLGRGPTSFVSQMGLRFGNKFSYCLMDYTLSPPPTSFLLIGGAENNLSAADVGNETSYKMNYTPLQTNKFSPTFYYIGIRSVYVGSAKLPIRPSVWAVDKFGNGGTVVDSGTTLTFLPNSAYDLILKAFIRRISLPMLDEPTPGFDLCLNVSGQPLKLRLPRLSFTLLGGSVLTPPPRNYFIDTEDGVKCLALQPVRTREGFAVIGNLMQQGYLFEFDKDRSRLGFTRRSCGSP